MTKLINLYSIIYLTIKANKQDFRDLLYYFNIVTITILFFTIGGILCN